MGWEKVTHEELAERVRNRFPHAISRTYVERRFVTVEKNGQQKKYPEMQVNIHVNKNMNLRTLMEIVNTFKEHARAKKAPTRLHIHVPWKGKKAVISIPLEKVPPREKEYPYFELAGTTLNIAPDWPRKGAANPREIVGQIIAVWDTYRDLPAMERRKLVAEDVKISVMRRMGAKKEVERETDADLLYLSHVKTANSEYYLVVPVEVFTGDAKVLNKKMAVVKELIKIVEEFAKREKMPIRVKPRIVYVRIPDSKRNGKNGNITKKIKNLFQKHGFPEPDVYITATATKSVIVQKNGKKNVKLTYIGNKKELDKLNEMLRAIAVMPEQFHTALMSIALKNRENDEILERKRREITHLRKKWEDTHINPAVKYYLTERYVEYALKGDENALEKAIKDTLKQFRWLSFEDLASRGARVV